MKQKRYAYCLGANGPKETQITLLKYAERDAERVATALKASPCAFIETEHIIATDREKVLSGLGQFIRQCGPEDLLIVHFSGHAIYEGELYLVCNNTDVTDKSTIVTSAIAIDDIKKILNVCSAHYKVLILDCCHAGGVHGGPFKEGQRIADSLNHALQGSAAVILAACSWLECTRELSTLDGGAGFLSWALVASCTTHFHQVSHNKSSLSLADVWHWIPTQLKEINYALPPAEQLPLPIMVSELRGSGGEIWLTDPTEKNNRERYPLHSSVFFFNMPLTDSHEFYGRARERETVLNRARQIAPVSVVGPRRIGKTWLLNYLKLVAPTQLGPNFRVGYLDATMGACATQAGFVAEALKVLYEPLAFPVQANLNLTTLENVVKDLLSKHQVPILCIDEFEAMCNQGDFNLSALAYLRAMTQVGLCLVVASRRPLIEIVAELAQKESEKTGIKSKPSPFFNVFEQLMLKPFTEEEAQSFVQAKGIQAEFTPEERALLLNYGKNDKQQWPPLRLQLVGKLLEEDKTLAQNKGSNYYRPDDPNYWKDFEERLEEKYQGVIGK